MKKMMMGLAFWTSLVTSFAMAQTTPSTANPTPTEIQNMQNELQGLQNNLGQAEKTRSHYLILGLSTTLADVAYAYWGGGFLRVPITKFADDSFYHYEAWAFFPVVVGLTGYSGHEYFKWYKIKKNQIPELQKQISLLQGELSAAQRAQGILQN